MPPPCKILSRTLRMRVRLSILHARLNLQSWYLRSGMKRKNESRTLRMQKMRELLECVLMATEGRFGALRSGATLGPDPG